MKNNIELPVSVLTKSQKQKFLKIYTEGHKSYTITASVRHDDQCGNGRNTFSITGDVRITGTTTDSGMITCGCIHEEIAKHFPNLAPFIKWHLTSTDAPMHYVANTVYLAGDRDHNGLKKGERKQIKNGRTGKLCWILEAPENRYFDGPTPPASVTLTWKPLENIGEGKERQLDAARSTAVWPEATDEELCQEPEQLKAALLARQSKLMADFKQAVESLGFIY